MEYEIAICTRNRPAALRLSLPRMLSQTVPPSRVLVVDSSDDHDEIVQLVDDLRAASGPELVLIRSEAGITIQRNVAIDRIVAPIVFFPDDDSLWAEDFAEHVMRVYERDTEELIGGITGQPVSRLPEAWTESAEPAYRMTPGHRLRQFVAQRRARIEHRLVPDPMVTISRAMNGTQPLPPWIDDEGAYSDTWVTGFRMSFRTAAIRRGCDETFQAYGAFEDVDLGFTVAQSHSLVGVIKAKVFHYQHPGGRGNGFSKGVTNIANRAYIVCKHTDPGHPARRQLRRYAYYRTVLYAIGGIRSSEFRESARGALSAARQIPTFKAADTTQLPTAYAIATRIPAAATA